MTHLLRVTERGLPFHSWLRFSSLAAHNYERKRYMPEHVPCPNTRRGRVNHVHPPFSERRRKTCWNKKKKKKQQKKAAISRAGSKLQPQQHTGAGPHCSHHNSGAAGHLAFKAHYGQVRTGSKPVGRIPN